MSETQRKRNSLLKSSISIDSIRSSTTNFSKGLSRTNILARDLVTQTRATNLFNSRKTAKDNEYFRKRRENIRRKNREDELESSSVSGVVKKEGNLITRSTKGFLGRILDFFGVVLIGWFVTTLPKILDAFTSLINRVKKFTALLTGFVEGIRDFFTGITDGIKTALEGLPKFDFDSFKNESEKDLENANNAMQLVNTELRAGTISYVKAVNDSIFTSDVDKSTLEINYGSEIENAYKEAITGQSQEEDKKEENNDSQTKLFGINVDKGGVFGAIARTFGGEPTKAEETELDKELGLKEGDERFASVGTVGLDVGEVDEDENEFNELNKTIEKGAELIDGQKSKDKDVEKEVDAKIKEGKNALSGSGTMSGNAPNIAGTSSDIQNEENLIFKDVGITGMTLSGNESDTEIAKKIVAKQNNNNIKPITITRNNLRTSKNENSTTVIVKEVAVGGGTGTTQVDFDDRGLSSLTAELNNNDSKLMEKIHSHLLNV
mgnify:FL=1|tara:strand:+ start:1867 stop:3342 length:1476 start_codon:yes stop_codon:yes gene_type:complete